jgi:ABC-type bacteriocin/lantibiotic exporters, contain an N-terminal double-glycine peptidase domain
MRVRRLLVPEVVQTSAMDCGPACLKSVLEAHGIHVSYDRLREVCQTSLDGTSIDTIEQVANELGVNAEQIIVPVDHVLLPKRVSIRRSSLCGCQIHSRTLWSFGRNTEV